MISKISKLVLIVLASVVATASLIYYTPLRYTDLIEPKVKDIDSIVFYEQYKIAPNNFLFIDVRSEESYKKIHARGSINIPLHVLYDRRHDLPKKGKEIILICSGGRASGVAYSYLEHYGFTNIHRISGGIEQWITNNLPTESILPDSEARPVSFTKINYCV